MPLPIFTDVQNKRVEALYLTEGRQPREIVSILMAENPGLVVTARQVSERISTKNLGKKRRELIAKAELNVAKKISAAATSLVSRRAFATDEHKGFLEASVRLGHKAMAKAAQILESSNSARDISSAVNAAAKGIDIYRKAVGLDTSSGPGTVGTTNYYFDFARSPESPFNRPPAPATAAPREAEKHTDVETVPHSGEPHAPSSPS
jgi:hypothetical protein